MSKLNQVWVIASGKSVINELTSGAALLGKSVSLLLVGDQTNALGANTVYYFGESGQKQTFLSYLPAMVQLAKEKKPDLIITDLSKNGRIAASYMAAAFQTNVMTDISEIWVENESVFSKRMVYGGSAFKTEKSSGMAVACVGSGVFQVGAPTAAGEIIKISVSYKTGIIFKKKAVKTVQAVNLAAAKRIVSVGRGLGCPDNLSYAEAFADAVGAEIACSRPVAEEEKWLPKERYVGVSGTMVKPDVYVAVGISGQVQHMAGANQSGAIVAINKDSAAPIFKQCDFGIVGDMLKILPTLTQKFKNK